MGVCILPSPLIFRFLLPPPPQPTHVPQAPKPKLNTACGLTTAHVLQKDGVVYEAELSYINLAQNSDKYYVIQVAEEGDKSAYYCVNHWGRTGTLGQFKLEKGSKEDAIEAFKAKFQAKTGVPVRARSNGEGGSKGERETDTEGSRSRKKHMRDRL